MSRWRTRLSVRARLTLWYAGVLTFVLVAYSGGVYASLRESLFSELDRQLRDDVEDVEESLSHLLATSDSVDEGFREQWVVELWQAPDALIRSWPSFQESPLGALPPSCGERLTTFHSTTLSDGLELRFACRTLVENDVRYAVRSARSSAKISDELRRLALPMLLALPFAVAVAALGGYALAWRALRPVNRMVEQARSISANRLSERLGVLNPSDELGRLATAFNETFERLEGSFEQMRRFTADASHELRTPLTAIRTTGEVALRGSAEPSAYREVIASILEEADALRQLVDNLLTLSRADSGQLKLEQRRIDVAALSSDVAQHLGVLAEEKLQTLKIEGEAEVFAHADPKILRLALINLVDNAIKYSPKGSTIRIRAERNNEMATVEVEDEGPGILPEHHQKVFERFYRVDQARSRPQGGTGLGLSISRWSVEANGGRLSLQSDGLRGAVFKIELPVSGSPSEKL